MLARAFAKKPTVSLDLAGVDFVDWAGVDALKRLSRAGIEIRCRWGPVASVLEAEGVRVTRDVGDLKRSEALAPLRDASE